MGGVKVRTPQRLRLNELIRVKLLSTEPAPSEPQRAPAAYVPAALGGALPAEPEAGPVNGQTQR